MLWFIRYGHSYMLSKVDKNMSLFCSKMGGEEDLVGWFADHVHLENSCWRRGSGDGFLRDTLEGKLIEKTATGTKRLNTQWFTWKWKVCGAQKEELKIGEGCRSWSTGNNHTPASQRITGWWCLYWQQTPFLWLPCSGANRAWHSVTFVIVHTGISTRLNCRHH